MKPNSILGSYLIKQTILNFLFVLAVICAIIMMFDMIEILRKRRAGMMCRSVFCCNMW